MSTVRAKFVVDSILLGQAWSKPKGTLQGTVKLRPVTGNSPENQRFYEATPGGSIELSIVPEETLAQFEIGDEIYVDFTPVAKAAVEGDGFVKGN